MSTRARQHQLGEEVLSEIERAPDPTNSAPSRITVGLIPTAWTALQWLMAHTRLNRTDVVNRAISVYAMVEEHAQQGHEMVFRDPATGKERIVEIV